MKYLTKEWVEEVGLGFLDADLKSDPNATVKNEEYYQEQYRAFLKSHTDRELVTWITEESEQSIRARTKRFINSHLDEHMRGFERLPDSLKAKIPDLRMLALHIASPDVIEEIRCFCETVRQQVKEIEKKARQASLAGEYATTAGKDLNEMAEKKEFPELYSFNSYFQEEVIEEIRWEGKNLRLHFMPDEDMGPAQDILILDAEVLEQDMGDFTNAYWLESETYYENGRFELHMLFKKDATPTEDTQYLYLTVRGSDIQLPD